MTKPDIPWGGPRALAQAILDCQIPSGVSQTISFLKELQNIPGDYILPDEIDTEENQHIKQELIKDRREMLGASTDIELRVEEYMCLVGALSLISEGRQAQLSPDDLQAIKKAPELIELIAKNDDWLASQARENIRVPEGEESPKATAARMLLEEMRGEALNPLINDRGEAAESYYLFTNSAKVMRNQIIPLVQELIKELGLDRSRTT
ncbi:MAG: hypothetical protein SFW63_09420 [Alphaproteobacteria bacterium]|nr:hypothetical protein [Alphaproteobacteria bacterium]